ncbi:PepSY domain-containing protein [Sphingobium sp. AS12]|uniref:PepSY-associated TM helix domain-containing protein n=1 Tax=Sphingobium sp. AS12 TaxID=2849495 RepID=UPI001C317FC8|nr:PepSY-associated TM helix domain-containing protein [Sphingobium sp. AS12]MBV2151223.1 PepSY domain-containing protein [Sphingobium sp. AS12]
MNRALMLRLHRIIGLSMAAFLLVQALSGAMLVYRGPLARLIDPVAMTSGGTGPEVSVGIAVTQANRAMAGYRVTRLFAPDADGASWFAQLGDHDGAVRYASVDPAGGAILRSGSVLAFPVEAALQIHFRLMAGKVGMAVVILNGIALLAMVASGLAYWWPKRGKMGKALAVRWTLSPRLVLRQCHRTAGVVLSTILLFMATTGLLLVVPEWLGSGAASAPSAASAATIDRSVALAQTAFPDAALRDLRIDGDRLIVNFHAPERNARAIHRVIVTLAQPHIVSATRAQTNPALWMSVLPLHAGDAFGAAGRAVLLIVALALAALCVSGPLIWWQAKAGRRPAPIRKSMA